MELDLPRDPESGLRVGRVILIGASGSGKTEMAVAFTKLMAPRSFEQVFIVSPAVRKLAEKSGRQLVVIDPTDSGAVEGFFGRQKYQRCLLVVDEFDSYISGSARSYGSPAIFNTINFGRNFGASLLLVAHGTNVIPKNLIENTNCVIMFRTTSVGLLDWAESYMQPDYPEIRTLLRELPKYWAVLYQPQAEQKFSGVIHLDIASGNLICEDLTDATSDPDASSVESGSSEGTGDPPTVETTTPPIGEKTPGSEPSDGATGNAG